MLRNNRGVMYVFVVIITALMLMATLWFVFYSAISPISNSITTWQASHEWAATSNAWTLANTFMLAIWTSLPLLILIGLIYWAWIYSQRKAQGYPG